MEDPSESTHQNEDDVMIMEMSVKEHEDAILALVGSSDDDENSGGTANEDASREGGTDNIKTQPSSVSRSSAPGAVHVSATTATTGRGRTASSSEALPVLKETGDPMMKVEARIAPRMTIGVGVMEGSNHEERVQQHSQTDVNMEKQDALMKVDTTMARLARTSYNSTIVEKYVGQTPTMEVGVLAAATTTRPEEPNAPSPNNTDDDNNEEYPAPPTALQRGNPVQQPVQPGAVSVTPHASDGGLGLSEEEVNDVEANNTPQTQEEFPPNEAGPTSGEILLNATLVHNEASETNNDNAMEVMEATPAPEGFQAIWENKKSKYLACGIVLIVVVVIVVVAVPVALTTGGGGNGIDESQSEAERPCGSRFLGQADYRGTLNVTETGKTCQAWSSQYPHSHTYSNEDDMAVHDLTNNYCRNPCGTCEWRAWCYTTDPNVAIEFCDVDFCGEEPLVLNDQCGTPSVQSTDYRGNLSTTATGKTCQRWDSQFPHRHPNKPEVRPKAGLEENYCRNPEDRHTWCYTTDPGTRWEYCDTPQCGSLQLNQSKYTTPCINCTKKECGTVRIQQEDYRGTQNTTILGYTCAPWNLSLELYDSSVTDELEGNYCRNPNRDRFPFCRTTDPTGVKLWDYCDIQRCEDPFIERRQCGSVETVQNDYRGDVAVSETGKRCDYWIGTLATRDGLTPWKRPFDGLIDNYCRNPLEPGMSRNRAWCYVVDTEVEWEYCNIDVCKDCGSKDLRQEDFSGTQSKTRSGKVCLPWEKRDHLLVDGNGNVLLDSYKVTHDYIDYPDRYGLRKDLKLEANYCRNPLGLRDSVWCFTGDSMDEWEYCDVRDCKQTTSTETNDDCGSATMNQADFRGALNVSIQGNPCMSWVSHDEYTPENYPSFGLDGNECRNPAGTSIFPLAWCFVNISGSLTPELCRVPTCESPGNQ